MSFEEDVQRRVDLARAAAAQQALADEKSKQAGLEALDGLQARCKEAAQLLSSYRIPTEPITSEAQHPGIFSSDKVIQKTLGQGWFMRRNGPGIILAPGGQLWETGLGRTVNYRKLHESAPFYFHGIRQSVLSREEKIKSPLGGFIIEFPVIYWDGARIAQSGSSDVRIRFDHSDSYPGDSLEGILTVGVAALVGAATS